MPAPPALPRRASALNTRLHLRPEEPPIPPRLIGSPLLEKLMTSPTASPRSAQEMWIDGDEFSVRKNGHAVLSSAPSQPQGNTRYATYPPNMSGSLAAAGAKLGSPQGKRCVLSAGACAVTQLTHTSRSSRPIAT
ncbi:hypothetical protein PsYK624_001590 [Phanerochaete sordida]|uniref:Uncharacterized protein n=1 Tax=Phanerochaete sordida TaxID=48140 RepID=A0A9P3L725_9APHY|nr:hypothetical protein PsYK624_001590 [Phanerochaete sordida]